MKFYKALRSLGTPLPGVVRAVSTLETLPELTRSALIFALVALLAGFSLDLIHSHWRPLVDGVESYLFYGAGMLGFAFAMVPRIKRPAPMEIFNKISHEIATTSGEEFYRRLVAQLSQQLQADYVCLSANLPGVPGQAQVLAFFGEGRWWTFQDYPLAGSLCEKIQRNGQLVCDREMASDFGQERFFDEKGLSTLIGAPLFNDAGMPIGVLSTMWREAPSQPAQIAALLARFAERAALEVQRAGDLERLANSEERYRAFLENSADAIWRLDFNPPVPPALAASEQVEHIIHHGFIAECNRTLARIYGYASVNDLIGKPLRDLLDPGDMVRMKALLRRVVESGYHVQDLEWHDRVGDDHWHWFSHSAVGVVEHGELKRLWGTLRDITERKVHLATLEYQASHDSLTGLVNRYVLYSRIQNAINECSRGRRMCALMLIDLDRFKEINDTLGHHSGDLLLKQVGPRLAALLPEHATLARLGGDEFAILLSECAAPSEAEDLTRTVLAALAQPFDVEGLKVEMGGCAGVVFYPMHGQDTSTLMRCADVSMYKAKTTASGYCVYSPDFDEHSPRRLLLLTDLNHALRQDALSVHYQPKIDVGTGRVTGVEALLRWQHPTHGWISPGQFIPVAESTELIRPLTLWVMDHALAQQAQWRAQGLELHVAVNLSARNLMDERLPDTIHALLERHGVPPDQLELEITESAVMAEPLRALEVLSEIHDMGVKLSIDDFGTGYSSLAYLRRLPIDMLKIDLSFVVHMNQNDQDAMIVHTIINLAHNLGLGVVAEGVENEATLSALAEIGCDQAQGYLMGRPMPAAQIAELYATHAHWRQAAAVG